jgi:hypothetical protein
MNMRQEESATRLSDTKWDRGGDLQWRDEVSAICVSRWVKHATFVFEIRSSSELEFDSAGFPEGYLAPNREAVTSSQPRVAASATLGKRERLILQPQRGCACNMSRFSDAIDATALRLIITL